MKFRTILLFGAPGAGKGTQGKILGAVPNLFHCACGDVFRNLTIGLGIMVAGILAVLASSPSLFNLWLGPGHFIGFTILIVFSGST